MKVFHFLRFFFLCGLLGLGHPHIISAQSPPGWSWAKQMGAYVGGFASRNDVAGLGRDAAGNLYLLGTYVGTPQFDNITATNLGAADVFLAKYDPAGTLLWLRTLQSTGTEAANALIVEPNGRCTVAGFFGSGTGGNLSLTGFTTPAMLPGPAVQGLPTTNNTYRPIPFLVAIDADGALLWADVPTPTYGLMIRSIQLDQAGNCYLSAGMDSGSQLTVNGQSYPAVGTEDAVLIKYTATGQPAWARRVGAVGTAVYASDLQTDRANAVYWLLSHAISIRLDQLTVGTGTSSNGFRSLVKLSATNRVLWAQSNLLRAGSGQAPGAMLALDAATSSIYLSAYSSGEAIAFDGPGSPLAVPANTYTTCVARCDTAGVVQWVKPVSFATKVSGGNPNPLGTAIQSVVPDNTGYTFVTTIARSAATRFVGSSQSFGLAESGLICVGHFTPDFQAEWLRVGGVAATWQEPGTELKGAATTPTGDIFVAGAFAGTAHFGPVELISSTPVHPDIFLAKLDQFVVTHNRARATSGTWSIYPNPATGAFQLADLPALAQLRLFDMQGRLVRTLGAAGAPGTSHSLIGVPPSLYFIQASEAGTYYQPRRLLVQ